MRSSVASSTSNTPETQEPVRRNNASRIAALSVDNKTKKKLRALDAIRDYDDGLKILCAKEYGAVDTAWSPQYVASMMLQLTPNLAEEHAVILKSLALIVEQMNLQAQAKETVTITTEVLIGEMADPLEGLREAGKRGETVIEGMKDEVDRMQAVAEELRLDLAEFHSSNAETLTQIQDAIKRLEVTKETSTNPRQTEPSQPGCSEDRQLQSQASTDYDYDRHFPSLPDMPLSQRIGPPSQLPPTHATTVARAEQKARQVLFRTAPGMPPHKLGELSHEAIVQKANVALEALATKRQDIPKGMRFLGVILLARGDVVFELSSKDAAEWLKSPDIRTSYMEGFGALTEIIDREHTLVVENVPVSFLPGTNAYLNVERANGLNQGDILLGRWFKKPEDRNPKQRTAYMRLTLRSAEAANHAIRHRLIIGGRRCNVRKLNPEPRRCFKCQKIDAGHMAHQCQSEHSICANCSQNHASQHCPVTDDIDKHRCANCDKAGHGAANRECPKYLQKREALQGKDSELLYRFFPTADTSTWELLNPTAESLVAYVPSGDEYRRMNEKNLAWIEERRRFLAETRTGDEPSQAKRAQEHRQQIKTSAAAVTNVGATDNLRQSRLQFSTTGDTAPPSPPIIRPASAPPVESPRAQRSQPLLEHGGEDLSNIRTERIMTSTGLSDISFATL